MTILSAWLWRMSYVGEPETAFGAHARAWGIALTIRNIGLMFIVLAFLFAPQIGDWLLGR
ncbi:hypothetical protein A3F55_01315 [Candidatus Adlerbacteria bacterium RIFCSPHIGHO2_12_FULL_53_18]|nr:MAG: hypothetical protein A3F55_01315 [Candidatus Adlerbacteria bacterium RIFCSPHIGHO2_12_FULL_53_18]